MIEFLQDSIVPYLPTWSREGFMLGLRRGPSWDPMPGRDFVLPVSGEYAGHLVKVGRARDEDGGRKADLVPADVSEVEFDSKVWVPVCEAWGETLSTRYPFRADHAIEAVLAASAAARAARRPGLPKILVSEYSLARRGAREDELGVAREPVNFDISWADGGNARRFAWAAWAQDLEQVSASAVVSFRASDGYLTRPCVVTRSEFLDVVYPRGASTRVLHLGTLDNRAACRGILSARPDRPIAFSVVDPGDPDLIPREAEFGAVRLASALDMIRGAFARASESLS